MGACTSAPRHRKKQHRQLHKQLTAKQSLVLGNKQASPSSLTVLPNQQTQRPRSLLTNFDTQSSSLTEQYLYQTDTNSLIQLYSSNMNNNNSNRNSWISTLSSSISNAQPRIPVPKTRLSIHPPQPSTGSKNVTTTVDTTNQTGFTRPMSITNRSSLPSSSQNTTQPRFGFIPRPTAPTSQQTKRLSLVERSRSTSPSSTTSANSASSFPSRSVPKTQTASNRSTIGSSNASKSKIPPSRTNKDSSTVTNVLRTNPPSRPSTSSSCTPSVLPTKPDVNSIRDRYKAPKRMSFFTRRTPITNSLKSPSIESSTIVEEKNEQSSTDEPTTNILTENQDDDLKTESVQHTSSSHGDSAYASTDSPSIRPPSAQHSQANRHRQRATSTLSSSSLLSNVLNQDGLLDDDNCSLKSDDLICDFDDTLTLDSVSKNNRTDSCSSNSFSTEPHKKSPMITPATATKPNTSSFQFGPKEHRSTTITKCLTSDKNNGSLRESLDELTRLSNRMDNIIDSEHNGRLLTRSVSLKPPPTSLPPREDAEQITMDIEAYRQVMKDVMVVKTILHQLDRLLKHSDGTNMTDSMIGSFHESMISSRHHSTSAGGEGNFRSNSIDDSSSYDDLAKELVILRKEKEQDKQTIKLLQEQMYKYSSQTNGS